MKPKIIRRGYEFTQSCNLNAIQRVEFKGLNSLTGLPNRVSFLPEELTGMSGATFTHNHPGGLSFSLEDIVLAWELRLTEVRVVTSRFRHLAFAFLAGVPDEKELQAAYDLEQRRLVAQTRLKVTVGELHPADFGTEVHHLIWLRLSRQYGFTYSRENS